MRHAAGGAKGGPRRTAFDQRESKADRAGQSSDGWRRSVLLERPPQAVRDGTTRRTTAGPSAPPADAPLEARSVAGSASRQPRQTAAPRMLARRVVEKYAWRDGGKPSRGTRAKGRHHAAQISLGRRIYEGRAAAGRSSIMAPAGGSSAQFQKPLQSSSMVTPTAACGVRRQRSCRAEAAWPSRAVVRGAAH